jgi:hypothetical protein
MQTQLVLHFDSAEIGIANKVLTFCTFNTKDFSEISEISIHTV